MDPVCATTSTPAATPAAPSTPAPTGGTSGAAPTFQDDLTKASAKLQPVKGHDYSKVLSGDHAGEYVNRSDNARKGQTFEIVRRAGRLFHVYGSGKDRTVVELPSAAKTAAEQAKQKAAAQTGGAAPSTTTPAATTTTGKPASTAAANADAAAVGRAAGAQ